MEPNKLKYVRVGGDNPHYVPAGYYSGSFSEAYLISRKNKNGMIEQVLNLEFLVRIPGQSQLRPVRKTYRLPSNRIGADLRVYFGDDIGDIMKGMDLDLEALNAHQDRCAEVEVTTFQGKGYLVPHSSVKGFYPCGTAEESDADEEFED